MDNKYYTPSIEEFHVGFEYEYYDVIQDKWIITTIKTYDDMYECPNDMSIDGNICAKYIRVKYLDKDDIESLGFYEAKLKDSNDIVYLKDVNQGFNTGYTVALSINHNSFVTISYKSFSSYMNKEYSIDVIIKNKSELAKLLKQLNIQ